MKIDEITVEGYKSIKSLKNFKLNNINILIGANGVGKSNFISIFKMLSFMFSKNLQQHTQDKGPDSFLYYGRKTTEKIYLEFKFGNNGYDVILVPTQDNRLIVEIEHIYYYSNHKWINTLGANILESRLSQATKYAHSKKIAEYSLDGIKSWKLYHFHDTSDTSKIKGVCAENDNLILKPDASNISAYLKRLYSEYRKYYDYIVYNISQIAPFFGGFIIRDSENLQLEWFDKSDPDTPLKAHILSDGTLRFICLATLLLQPFELMPDTIIIDEPELGLHPAALSLLSELIKRVSGKKQLILSSQSVELINNFEPEDIIVVDRKNNESMFKRLDGAELSIWLDKYSLGDIWKSNLIGGRP